MFWCEDQGDLAFYDAVKQADGQGPNLDAGDMVQFDIVLDRKMRKARNARLIQQNVCDDLPETLRRTARHTPESDSACPTTAEIIPFGVHAAASQAARAVRKA